MASISNEYMINEGMKGTERNRQSESFAFYALMHSIKTDLLPLLMATKFRMNRIPIVYLSEAHT